MKGINLHCQGILRRTVTEDMTARQMKSGSLRVLATPAVVALMEEAACEAIAYFMEDGETTVGTSMSIDHVAPSPVGKKIRVEADVQTFSKREIVFHCTAYDEDTCALIASGTHKRVVVNWVKFQEKADKMLEAGNAVAAT
ncbi:MAG: thioesterase family protein [Oscillospiraceae bacterium]|nr:thioesterase family protein [Oscillospiraceae bacterium]